MTKVEMRPRFVACIGALSAVALMLFAGGVVSRSPLGEKASAFLGRRRLAVDTGKEIIAQTTLSRAVPANSSIIAIVANPLFLQGQKIIIEQGTLSEEVVRIRGVASAGVETNLELKNITGLAHALGAAVVVQEESIATQSMHQSSSGSLHTLRTFASFGESSNSLGSVESGSLKGNLAATAVATPAYVGLGSWLFQMIICVCIACAYKSKVVDPMGILPHRQLQYENHDDFHYSLCDCLKKDFSMCCVVTWCPILRMAHTNAVLGVSGFWETIMCLWCSALCCGPIGPCCLNVYFRIHIKDHMGIEDHCFMDMLAAWCCLPCITGQQAMSVDEAAGFRYGCPCTLERVHGHGGYSETQMLNYS